MIDINEAVHFRIDVPDLESQNILLEVELLFSPEERYTEEKSDGEEGRSQRRRGDEAEMGGGNEETREEGRETERGTASHHLFLFSFFCYLAPTVQIS